MRCPVCRAENAAGPQCRRCRADLSLLFTLEAQRARALDAAYRGIAGNQLGQALARAGEADACRRDGESQRLLAVLHLLRGELTQAWQCYAERLQPDQDL
jgi:hypothetical protein